MQLQCYEQLQSPKVMYNTFKTFSTIEADLHRNVQDFVFNPTNHMFSNPIQH